MYFSQNPILFLYAKPILLLYVWLPIKTLQCALLQYSQSLNTTSLMALLTTYYIYFNIFLEAIRAEDLEDSK